jgi:hypothetical protein
MEMIAMLNGIPSTFDNYLTSQARSVIRASDYNANLAGLGAYMADPFTSDPTLPQRGGWQRNGLQRGMSRSAAATFAGMPTTAMSVADQVRANSIASRIYNNRMAGIPESPAAAVKAAQANIISSSYYNRRLAGLGAEGVAASDGTTSGPVNAETAGDTGGPTVEVTVNPPVAKPEEKKMGAGTLALYALAIYGGFAIYKAYAK